MFFLRTLLSALLLLSLSQTAISFMACGDFLHTPPRGESAMHAFHQRFVARSGHPFVNVGSVRESFQTRSHGFAGNAVNLIQGIRDFSGLELLPEPQQTVKDLLERFPKLNDRGLLEPQTIYEVMVALSKVEVPTRSVSVITQALSGLNESKRESWPNVQRVQSLEPHFYNLKLNEFKIVQVYHAGRVTHAPKSDFTFILTKVDGSLLSVMAPHYPSLGFTLRNRFGILNVTKQVEGGGLTATRVTKARHTVSIVETDPESALYKSKIIHPASIPVVYSVTTVTVFQ